MKTKTKKQNPRAEKNVPETVSVAWIAHEYPYHQKSLLWFIGAAVIVVSLVVYGLLTDGWTFSMAIIIAAAAYYVSHRNPPDLVTISVTNKGIRVGRHLIDFTSIKYFWISYNPPITKRLYLRLKSRIAANITIELEDVDVQELSRELKKHLTENQNLEEPFSDSLIRLFKL